MANLFAVFYLISAMKLYDAAVALGVLIASSMTIWDMGASPATRVTLTLYTLLSILMGCVISALIETFFAQTHPSDAVLNGIQQRLALAEKLLRKGGDSDADIASLRIQLGRYTTRGTGDLRELLAHSSYDGSYKSQLTTVIALSGQLIELSVNLGETIGLLSSSDTVRCNSIAQTIAGIRLRLVQEEAPDWLALSDEEEYTNPTLAEIERNVELIAESFSDSDPTPHHHLPEPGEQPKMGIFQDDAFRNPEHLRFAIREP
jgi:multidrug resistance protein MdtO